MKVKEVLNRKKGFWQEIAALACENFKNK